MQRLLLLFFGVIILLLLPSHVLALSCTELDDVNYFLACEGNVCESFKVEEEYEGGACNRLPYVFSLSQTETAEIYHHLLLVTGRSEMNGLWKVTMPSSCSYFLQQRFSDLETAQIYCGEQVQEIRFLKLADSFRSNTLAVWRDREDRSARSERTAFYVAQNISFLVYIGIGTILPLTLTLSYIKRRHSRVFILAILGQFALLFFLVNSASIFYFVRAALASLITFCTILIEVILLVRMYLKNRSNPEFVTTTLQQANSSNRIMRENLAQEADILKATHKEVLEEIEWLRIKQPENATKIQLMEEEAEGLLQQVTDKFLQIYRNDKS